MKPRHTPSNELQVEVLAAQTSAAQKEKQRWCAGRTARTTQCVGLVSSLVVSAAEEDSVLVWSKTHLVNICFLRTLAQPLLVEGPNHGMGRSTCLGTCNCKRVECQGTPLQLPWMPATSVRGAFLEGWSVRGGHTQRGVDESRSAGQSQTCLHGSRTETSVRRLLGAKLFRQATAMGSPLQHLHTSLILAICELLFLLDAMRDLIVWVQERQRGGSKGGLEGGYFGGCFTAG
jgi:hypothetical protein